MELAAKLDDYGKGAWIGVMVLAFILYWPAGLAVLAYLIWSGRMGCWGKRGPGRWHKSSRTGAHRSNESGGFWSNRRSESSGNHAFDEYREETLRRLEEEQSEFFEFLERLRHAKDKAEFDQFMAERKRGPGGADNADSPAPA